MALGTNFLSNSNWFKIGTASDVPVTLFTEFCILFAKPDLTGSVTAVITIGMSFVAFKAD